MKKQIQQYQDNDNQINRSCPPKLQQDVTKSINEQDNRIVKSQQIKHNADDQFIKMKQQEKKQHKNKNERKLGVHEKPFSDQRIEVKITHIKGTDFGCQKVQSLQLSCEEESYRSGSLKGKNKKSQEIEEPKSGKKPRKDKQKQNDLQQYDKRQDIKEESLNVLVAGAEDTGKTTFIRCFKRKQRKNDSPRIKPKTRQIRYELGMGDQNLANRRNTVHFIDLGGFSQNQEDKYLRDIKQYAVTQLKNYEKPEDDRRIHCCLYFLRGPRIKDTDIYVMKSLSQMFNLIPLIAKSDQYTKDEILEIKEEFQRKVSSAGEINLYDLEQFYRLKLGTEKANEAIMSKFGKFPPFVIASSFQKQSPQCGGFVRKYPWGKVEIENEEHTDFEKLSELLSRDIRSQLVNKMFPVQNQGKQQEIVEHLQGQQVQVEIQQKPRISLKEMLITGSVVFAVLAGVYLKLKKPHIG